VSISRTKNQLNNSTLREVHIHTLTHAHPTHHPQTPPQQQHHDASQPRPGHFAPSVPCGHLCLGRSLDPFRHCLGCLDNDPRDGHGHLLASRRQDWQACTPFHCGTCGRAVGVMVAWLVLAFFVSARVRHSWNDGGTRHVFILPPDNCVVNGVGTFVLPPFLWLVFFHP